MKEVWHPDALEANSTIKNILVKPKDPLARKSGAIYWYLCGELMCDEEYIGETSRTFGERYKAHLKEPSPIYGHSNVTQYYNITIILCLRYTEVDQTFGWARLAMCGFE